MRAGAGAWSRWLLLIAVEVSLAWTMRSYVAMPGAPQGASDLATFTDILTIFATVAGSVGLFLRLRRPGNAVATLLALGPILVTGGFLGYAIGNLRGITVGPHDALGGLGVAIASAILVPGLVMLLPGVAIAFPDGHLAGPRFRPPVRVVVALTTVSSLASLVADHPGADPSAPVPANPIAVPGLPREFGDAAGALGSVALVLAFGLAVASVVVRFRRATLVERQQLKWFLAAVIVNAVLLPVSFLTDVGPAQAIDLASVLAATLMPLAIGVAILRYRLYEIDTIINRALVYGALTAILAGLMSAAVGLTKSLFEDVLGTGTDWSVIVSTIVVVSAFEPIKKRVQVFVDRRWKPAEDPSRALQGHVHRLGHFPGTLDPPRTMRETLAVAQAAYRARGGRLTWSVPGSGGEVRVGPAGDLDTPGDGIVATVSFESATAEMALTGVGEPGVGTEDLETALLAVLVELLGAGSAEPTAREVARRDLPDGVREVEANFAADGA